MYDPVPKKYNYSKSNILRGIPKSRKRSSQVSGKVEKPNTVNSKRQIMRSDLSPRMLRPGTYKGSKHANYRKGKPLRKKKSVRVQNISNKRIVKDSHRISGFQDIPNTVKRVRSTVGSQIDLISDNLQRWASYI